MKKLLILFFPVLMWAQNASEFRVNHYSVNNGLSQYDVSSILQDKLGFMWVGTYDGLNRFDGFQPRIFRHHAKEKSISNNRTVSLETDLQGNIWVGGDNGGLSIFNILKSTFFNIKFDSENPLNKSTVSVIKRLSNGRMVIILQGGGIYYVDVKGNDVEKNNITLIVSKIKIKLFQGKKLQNSRVLIEVNRHILIGSLDLGLTELIPDSKHSVFKLQQIVDRPVNTAFVDAENCIWVGTHSGLILLKYFDSFSSCVDLTRQLPQTLINKENITAVCEDNHKQKWIGTASDGLYLLQKNNSRIDVYTSMHYLKSNSSLHSNRITKLFIDKSNILWIGSNNDGLGFSDLSRKIFSELRLNQFDENKNSPFISSVFADNYDNVWVGSEDLGLFRVDKKRNKIDNYNGTDFGIESQIVNTCALQDMWGNLWFGTWNGCYQLKKTDIYKSKFKFEKLTGNELNGKMNAAVYSMSESEKGELWLGTKIGLYRLFRNKSNGAVMKIQKYLPGTNEVSSNVFSVCCLGDYQVFAGTKGNGAMLITYQPNTSQIQIESFNVDQKFITKRLSNNNVWCIRKAAGFVWMGTDEGVVKLIKKNHSYEVLESNRLNESIGFCKVVSVEEDQQGSVWLATNDGAVRVNAKTDEIQFFRNKEGLKSNTVSAIAVRRVDGIMYFGGIKGVNYCNPDELNPPQLNIVPKIIQIKINGNDMLSLAQKGDIDNVNDAPFLKKLYLKHSQNNIALTISTFEFMNPSGSDFQYKMEGRDENWITSRNGERVIIYQNLPPGKYKFLLKSSKDLDHSKIQPSSITFVIAVPPWYQWWAILIYVVIIASILYFVSGIFRSRLRLDNELKMEKYTRAQERELNEIKTKLFVNISHELRTPLSLILSPVKEIAKFELDEQVKKLFNIVQYNSNRLLMLTNQILDAEKNDHLILNIEKRDLVALLKLIVSNFSPLAEEKNIAVTEHYSSSKINGFVDRDIIEKIVSNLILNSIKYTPINGNIEIWCQPKKVENTEFVEISIQDNGKGISKDKIAEIFKPFFQIEGGNGFGVGLSAVKQMVESHLGNITVYSEENQGSTFVVNIPISKHSYALLLSESEQNDSLQSESERKISNSAISKKSDSATILLVEDNKDLRQYITDCLMNDFVVYTAENGEDGFQKSKQFIPDLIVSDIMMPVMDGLEMAKMIYTNESTKHIPVLFLSAKGSLENQFEGINIGAVDYIIKPVDLDMLKSKINNHIHIIRSNRERVRNLYLHSSEPVADTSEENEFISRAHQIISENLSNSLFDVTLLASEMACSKMQLHRRFKAIMDTSPGEFIRLTKLKIAYNYLVSGSHNVSEIVLLCGFENHSHFTKMIKQHFGKTPRVIIAESKDFPKNDSNTN